MSLHAPHNRQVIELIASGQIGALHLINNWFTYYLSSEAHDNIH
jgi:predicted dehydrogenase